MTLDLVLLAIAVLTVLALAAASIDFAIGHASIRTQLDWCAEGGVREALFTHCGSQIVKGDEQAIAKRVHDLGRAVGVRAGVASDGLEVSLAKAAKASRARGR
ncbi:MAG: hypothetical protein WD805_05500 [Gaiellaceae bacterium]